MGVHGNLHARSSGLERAQARVERGRVKALGEPLAHADAARFELSVGQQEGVGADHLDGSGRDREVVADEGGRGRLPHTDAAGDAHQHRSRRRVTDRRLTNTASPGKRLHRERFVDVHGFV